MTNTRGSKRGRNTLLDTPNTSQTFIKGGRTRDIYLAKALEHMIKVFDEIPQPVKLIFPPNMVQETKETNATWEMIMKDKRIQLYSKLDHKNNVGFISLIGQGFNEDQEQYSILCHSL